MTTSPTRNDALGLFFPQWQGAGEVPALETGAHRLRARLDGVGPWARVDVPALHPLRREAGVWGHGELVAQLGAVELGLTDPGGPSVTTYAHLTAPDAEDSAAQPGEWDHAVTGEGLDAGMSFRCRWAPLPLSFELAGDQGKFLAAVSG